MTQRPVVCIIKKKRSKIGEKSERTEVKEADKEDKRLIEQVFGKPNMEVTK